MYSTGHIVLIVIYAPSAMFNQDVLQRQTVPLSEDTLCALELLVFTHQPPCLHVTQSQGILLIMYSRLPFEMHGCDDGSSLR